jgi:hypothetical protein
MRTKNRYRIRSGRAVVASVAAGGLLLAACGGGGDSGVAALEDEAAPAGDGLTDTAATEEALSEYTECLRGQGVPIEDPVVDADGNVTFGGPSAGASKQEFYQGVHDAEEVCGPAPGGADPGGNHGGADQAELEDAFLELAECMRDEGFDMPDPDLSGGNPFPGIDTNAPAFQDAFDECQDVLSGLGG